MAGYDFDCNSRRRLWRSSRPERSLEESLCFSTVFGPEGLYRVLLDLKSNPRCAGVDGYTFANLSLPEGAEICRRLAEQIRDETYLPGPTLPFQKQKPCGGSRTLQIPQIMDHLVARTAHEAISPFAERIFCRQSYGFRPTRTSWHMLAKVARHLQVSRRPYFAAYDITAAFDRVRIEPIITAIGRLFDDIGGTYENTPWPTMLRLILGGANQQVTGIGQGNPLSPLALNIALHYVIDLPFVGSNFQAFWRWGDNIYFSSSDASVLSLRRAAISIGLRSLGVCLHGKRGNLCKGFVPTVLGFEVKLHDMVPHFEIGCSAWGQLEAKLNEAHDYPDPPTLVEDLLVGWLAAQGPALSNPAAMLDRIMEIARRTTGLTPVRAKLERQALRARRKWEGLLRRVLQRK